MPVTDKIYVWYISYLVSLNTFELLLRTKNVPFEVCYGTKGHARKKVQDFKQDMYITFATLVTPVYPIDAWNVLGRTSAREQVSTGNVAVNWKIRNKNVSMDFFHILNSKIKKANVAVRYVYLYILRLT